MEFHRFGTWDHRIPLFRRPKSLGFTVSARKAIEFCSSCPCSRRNSTFRHWESSKPTVWTLRIIEIHRFGTQTHRIPPLRHPERLKFTVLARSNHYNPIVRCRRNHRIASFRHRGSSNSTISAPRNTKFDRVCARNNRIPPFRHAE